MMSPQTVVDPHSNGATAREEPSRPGNRAERRMPIRTATIALDGDYAGWTVRMRTNPPLSAFEQFTSGSFRQIREALTTLLLDWNFVDEDGAPLPLDGGVEHLPVDLLEQLIDKYVAAMNTRTAVPKG